MNGNIKKTEGQPTIIFDRGASVDAMFDAIRAVHQKVCEADGTPLPPLHPCDSKSYPEPVAPAAVA